MTENKFEFVDKADFDTAMRALRCALDENERLAQQLRWTQDANAKMAETTKRLAKEVDGVGAE